MRRPRSGSCRYGSLGLVGCLVAIAVPEVARGETCHITAVPASPVTVGAVANLTSGCTGTPLLTQWTSSLANCAPTTGAATNCTFPTVGNALVTVRATYAGSFGGSFTVSNSYPMTVKAPICNITAAPGTPITAGFSSSLASGCTGSPTLIQWTSSLANCAPATGASTICNFPTVGTAVITVKATYTGSFGGSFVVSDSYNMKVTAKPKCNITAVPGTPIQVGFSSSLAAGCGGSPSLIQWTSSLANCAPATGANTVCNFPTVGMAVVTVKATYTGSFGSSFAVTDSYNMKVNAPPACHISASPGSPILAGFSSSLSAGCTGSPTLIQWTSSLANCAPATGPTTSCNFPTVGNAVITVRATYVSSFGGSFTATDSYPMTVNAPLAIVSPISQSQFSLTDANFTATPIVTFQADPGGGNEDVPVKWRTRLEYRTTAGRGFSVGGSFETIGTGAYQTNYAGIGGRLTVEASARTNRVLQTAGPNVVFITGTSIPEELITRQLIGLYDGPTPNLMTGIAAVESDYQQFRRMTLYDFPAQWPNEGPDDGNHIGLMQVPVSQAHAWDWTANARDGVAAFYEQLANARRTEAALIARHEGLRELTDVERENMALARYGPYGAAGASKQYYIPVRNADRVWDWAVNTEGNPDAVAYADAVRQNMKGGPS